MKLELVSKLLCHEGECTSCMAIQNHSNMKLKSICTFTLQIIVQITRLFIVFALFVECSFHYFYQRIPLDVARAKGHTNIIGFLSAADVSVCDFTAK